MSRVLNAVLHVEFLDDRKVPEYNAHVAAKYPDSDPQYLLQSLTDGAAGDMWGGSKAPEVHLYAAALNYCPVEALTDALTAIGWDYPGSVQLFIKDQEDERFSVWMIRDGHAVKVIG